MRFILKRKVARYEDDFKRYNGKRITVVGRYRSIPMPCKGQPRPDAPRNFAVITLDDGSEIFIEPMDSPKAKRSLEERQRFEGKKVRVSGTAHRIMPSQGQSLIDPCISDVHSIIEDDEQ